MDILSADIPARNTGYRSQARTYGRVSRISLVINANGSPGSPILGVPEAKVKAPMPTLLCEHACNLSQPAVANGTVVASLEGQRYALKTTVLGETARSLLSSAAAGLPVSKPNAIKCLTPGGRGIAGQVAATL